MFQTASLSCRCPLCTEGVNQLRNVRMRERMSNEVIGKEQMARIGKETSDKIQLEGKNSVHSWFVHAITPSERTH